VSHISCPVRLSFLDSKWFVMARQVKDDEKGRLSKDIFLLLQNR